MQEIQNKIKELLTVSRPISTHDPEWSKKRDEQHKAQTVLMNELKALARQHNTMLGRVIEFPVADGEALYLVTKLNARTVTVEWLTWYDDWVDDRLGYKGTLPIDYAQKKVDWYDKWEKLGNFTVGNFTVDQIRDFLDTYGIKVSEDEDPAITELMMNTGNVCIVYEKQQYYVNKNNTFYTKDDEEMLDYLRKNHSL